MGSSALPHGHCLAGQGKPSAGKCQRAGCVLAPLLPHQDREGSEMGGDLGVVVVESLSLEVFSKCGDVALRGMVRWALAVGLHNFRGLF